jgi:hypothetical protein
MNSDNKYFNNMITLLKQENDISIRKYIIESLSHVTNLDNFTHLINNYQDYVKEQDYISYFHYLSKNHKHQKILIDFLINIFDKNNKKIILEIFLIIISNVYDIEYINMIDNYIQYHNNNVLIVNKIKDVILLNKKIINIFIQ